jgi:hypothetical protein
LVVIIFNNLRLPSNCTGSRVFIHHVERGLTLRSTKMCSATNILVIALMLLRHSALAFFESPYRFAKPRVRL